MENQSLFNDSLKILDTVEKIGKINPEIIEQLKLPQRIVEVNLPIKMDNGELQIFKGYRSQHNNFRGPYKGGIRFHPNVSLDEVMSLSFWMSIKCAVAGIPFGGGKGGIIVDVKSLSEGELERLSKAYAKAIAPIIGPKVDVPAPDVDTNAQVMSWMLTEYEKTVGHSAPATITGKPINRGGSQGREEATGLGGAYLLDNIAKLIGKNKNDITISIQGFGNVGLWFGLYAEKFGYKVVAVSDSKGGIYNPKGIDINKIRKIKESGKSVSDYDDGEKIGSEEVLTIPADIIVPAALEKAITPQNAGLIKAKVILEMANGPTAPDAEKILAKKNVIIVPDVLANSGGVTVSYFEWFQNINKQKWTIEKVRLSLKKKITGAWRETHEKSKKHKTSLRIGAYILAVERIAAKA
jgi:glutamate dehydrogenase